MLSRYWIYVRSRFSWLMACALVAQPLYLSAAPIANSKSLSVTTTGLSSTADVALKSGGVLSGQVFSQAGTAIVGAVVQVQAGQQVWQTRTNAKGWFHFVNLRGGTYQLQAAGQSQLLRAWAKGTAPPHAREGLLVIPPIDVIRGQRVLSPNTNQFFRVAKKRLANPLVVGGIVATAVAIPVGIHNLDDDDTPATP